MPEGKRNYTIPEQENYYIFPLKVNSIRIKKNDIKETMILYKTFNELLGYLFIIWLKFYILLILMV